MRKALEFEFADKPLQILSAFQRETLSGVIYVEARSQAAVQHACSGLIGVFMSRGVTLVPIEEMAALLTVKKKEVTLELGAWVRIKRGKYAGDLAQIVDMTENGDEVGIRFIPRIELTPRDDVDGKKRKKGATLTIHARPPQKFFNFEEVASVFGRKAITKRGNTYMFGGEQYTNGYLEKDIKTSALITENVNPTLDEITKFAKQQDGTDGSSENNVNLAAIAEASRKAAIVVLQPGDNVEVFEGEQTGVHGVVESIVGEIALLRAEGLELEGQKVEVPAKSVRKRFKPGDHVKVMAGKNIDETGLVVNIKDNVVTFLSDMTLQEVRVIIVDFHKKLTFSRSLPLLRTFEWLRKWVLAQMSSENTNCTTWCSWSK
jgi:transcription elongation factor SPT5